MSWVVTTHHYQHIGGVAGSGEAWFLESSRPTTSGACRSCPARGRTCVWRVLTAAEVRLGSAARGPAAAGCGDSRRWRAAPARRRPATTAAAPGRAARRAPRDTRSAGRDPCRTARPPHLCLLLHPLPVCGGKSHC